MNKFAERLKELRLELREEAFRILQSIDTKLNFHDFRVVKGETHTNVLFDVLVPVSFAIGIGIGFIGSYITVRKHLRV